MDVTISRSTSLASAGVTVHRTRLERIDRVKVDGIPCTSATRTVIDLARLLNDEALETA
jgi:hypothetical protein